MDPNVVKKNTQKDYTVRQKMSLIILGLATVFLGIPGLSMWIGLLFTAEFVEKGTTSSYVFFDEKWNCACKAEEGCFGSVENAVKSLWNHENKDNLDYVSNGWTCRREAVKSVDTKKKN